MDGLDVVWVGDGRGRSELGGRHGRLGLGGGCVQPLLVHGLDIRSVLRDRRLVLGGWGDLGLRGLGAQRGDSGVRGHAQRLGHGRGLRGRHGVRRAVLREHLPRGWLLDGWRGSLVDGRCVRAVRLEHLPRSGLLVGWRGSLVDRHRVRAVRLEHLRRCLLGGVRLRRGLARGRGHVIDAGVRGGLPARAPLLDEVVVIVEGAVGAILTESDVAHWRLLTRGEGRRSTPHQPMEPGTPCHAKG